MGRADPCDHNNPHWSCPSLWFDSRSAGSGCGSRTGNFQALEESGKAFGACTVSSECPKRCFFYPFPAPSEGMHKWAMPGDIFVFSSCSMFMPHHQELSDVFIFGCVIFQEIVFTPLKGKSWTFEEFRLLSPILPPDLCSHHLHIYIIPFLHAFPKNSHLFANFNSSVVL